MLSRSSFSSSEESMMAFVSGTAANEMRKREPV
jgi:hypothetical protein